MQNANSPKPILNVLVLAALIGTVLFGWLSGHVLRYSILTFRHPPVQETDPHIKNGYQLEFQDKRATATLQPDPWVRVYIAGMPAGLQDDCPGLTYYTSLPAKCRTADGRLVRILVPGGK